MSAKLLGRISPRWPHCVLLASLLLWASIGSGQGDRFTVFDLEGNVRTSISRASGNDSYNNPVLSPDGTFVALRKSEDAGSSLWVWDLETGERTQLTFVQTKERVLDSAVWSPDGTELAYPTLRGDYYGIHKIRADGTRTEQLLYRHDGGPLFVLSWSSDGQSISFLKPDPYARDQSQRTLYTLRLDEGNRVYETLLPEAMPSTGGARGQSGAVGLSPNDQWLAYASPENSAWEIYLRYLPESQSSATGPDKRWRVSNGDAYDLVSWRNDNREFYYLTAEGIMAVAVGTEPEIAIQSPRLLAPATKPMRTLLSEPWPRRFGNIGPAGNLFVLPEVPDPLEYRITLFDRHGEVTGTVGPPGIYGTPTLSSDGAQVLVERLDPDTGFTDAWAFDVQTGRGRRLTTDWAPETHLAWHPDGGIGYVKNHAGTDDIYFVRSNDQSEELLFRYLPGTDVTLDDFSPDGRLLSVTSGGVLLLVLLETSLSERRAIEYGRAEFSHRFGRFSPLANLIAYISDETGEFQLYVQEFDSATGEPRPGKWQISRNGATGTTSWNRAGDELYYVQPASNAQGRSVMAVSIDTSAGFEPGGPEELFVLRDDVPDQRFLSPDGERFVFLVPESNSGN